jgi:hypothetical protein
MSNKNFFADPGTTYTLISNLTDNITASATEINILNASNFPTKGTIQIDTELIKFSNKTGNTLTDCVRSEGAVSHLINAVVTLIPRTPEGPLGTTPFYAGWYKERGSSTNTLRVTDSNLMMEGAIRFNNVTNTFQGFNGAEWVTFNAEKGDPGMTGASASTLFNFINLPEGITVNGEIFKDKTETDIYLRSLASGTFDLNAGVTGVQSLTIDKSDDYLTLTPTPRPYVWDFSTPELSNISFLKSSLAASKLKAFGKVSKWRVKTGSNVVAGTAVRVTLSTPDSHPTYNPNTTYLVIEPYTYEELSQESHEGAAFLGIALETVTGDGTLTCEVCTEGVTTIKIGDLTTTFDYGVSLSNTIAGVGSFGFIGSNSEIYNVPSTGFVTNPPIAGYWLEKGVFTSGNAVLFHVQGTFVFN